MKWLLNNILSRLPSTSASRKIWRRLWYNGVAGLNYYLEEKQITGMLKDLINLSYLNLAWTVVSKFNQPKFLLNKIGITSRVKSVYQCVKIVMLQKIESGMAGILVNCTSFFKYHRDILTLNLFRLHTNSFSNRQVQLTFTRSVMIKSAIHIKC